MLPVLPVITVLKVLTIPLSALQEPREGAVVALERRLWAIVLSAQPVVNSAQKETL